MSPRVLNVLKIAVTLALVIFLLTRIDLARMASLIAGANWLLLLLALALYFAAIGVGVLKWLILVRAQEIPSTFTQLLAFNFVALFFGNVLPSNVGGDLIRGYDLARAAHSRREAAATSVLVDRLIGLIAFLGVAVVMAFLATLMFTRGSELEQIEIASGLVAVALIGASALLFSRRVARRGAFLFEWRPLTPFRPLANKVFDALQVYRAHLPALMANGALSLTIVVVTTFVWYAVARSLGIDVPLFYFLLFNPLIAFVLLIPISFNGLGAKEAAVVFFFGLVGVPNEAAFSMSLLFHLIVVLTSLPGGILWWRQRTLKPQLQEAA